MRKKLYHRIISGILALTLVFLLVACDGKESKKVNTSDNKKSSTSSTSDTVDYASKLFDTSYVHTIDISISDDDWNDLKANPLEKTKYKVNITIDGETIESVSFATKGNTSLTSVASDTDSDRYSFKVDFGKYTKDQT